MTMAVKWPPGRGGGSDGEIVPGEMPCMERARRARYVKPTGHRFQTTPRSPAMIRTIAQYLVLSLIIAIGFAAIAAAL